MHITGVKHLVGICRGTNVVTVCLVNVKRPDYRRVLGQRPDRLYMVLTVWNLCVKFVCKNMSIHYYE